ncbi:MAG TPA: 2-oxoacid:acceptor oxidoreductase family protein [Spirochaetota bacterium]|nr:2-oxoacid:acceptor oxidoreductase family protein [Spirochaetota bacterium]HOM39013.1 2-oxoacid:acceptor oxidoreductase family protein [Spirochaetota bacterium]HPQ49941.1 2-oxoacid:acceptor oxidoreductase family protein [Spirochaetota bacterium]
MLPITNQYGLFEVRFESIGGLGANIAGKMLAEAGLKYLNLNVASFSSYGSEKTGTPIKTFVRFSDPEVPIKINSPVENPHLLVIFHENLINALPVTLGCNENTIIIVNTKKSPSEIQDMLKIPTATIGTVDAIGISLEEKVKFNGILLGAISKAIGFIKPEHIKGIFEDIIGKKYPAVLEANFRAIERGYNEVKIEKVKEKKEYSFKPFAKPSNLIGYENQIIGGLVVNPGNSFSKDLSASRNGLIPVFNSQKCTSCGMCDIVCPDLCMVFIEENGQMIMKGIDYQYCKGCLKCVQICPVKALTEGVEAEYDVKSMTVKLFTEKDTAQNHR